jgi:hypothetical protein
MLCDEIQEWLSNDIIRKVGIGGVTSELLQSAVKFDLSDDVTYQVGLLSASKPKPMLEAMKVARLPYPVCWFEFNAAPRGRGYAAGGIVVSDDPECRHPTRIGLLMIDLKEEGSGCVLSIPYWRNPTDAGPYGDSLLFRYNCSPFALRIHSDPVHSLNFQDIAELQESMAASNHVWHSYRHDQEAMKQVIDIFQHHDLIQTTEKLDFMSAEMQEGAKMDSASELGFVTMLTMALNSKKLLSTQTVSMDRLNAQRQKAGKSKLSDYVQVRLSSAVKDALHSPGPAPERDPHWVRGHFKQLMHTKAGPQLVWWSPHIRGGGQPEVKGYRVG